MVLYLWPTDNLLKPNGLQSYQNRIKSMVILHFNQLFIYLWQRRKYLYNLLFKNKATKANVLPLFNIIGLSSEISQGTLIILSSGRSIFIDFAPFTVTDHCMKDIDVPFSRTSSGNHASSERYRRHTMHSSRQAKINPIHFTIRLKWSGKYTVISMQYSRKPRRHSIIWYRNWI